ncbi:unnamed protein product [Brachionus calyciflorus]|uniref:Metal transporter CNNM4 n=1 Tax=Brachionus calyciflorus TaxID=104777 RepID=A0A813MC08_9BILA|nr:unnamed protein product [Brachionus calyciflorus]
MIYTLSYFFLIYSLILNINTYNLSDSGVTTTPIQFHTILPNKLNENLIKNTFDILYLIPDNQDDVLELNQKHTIGDKYDTGWILPSEEPVTLNFYLYYEGNDEGKVKQFLRNNSEFGQNQPTPNLYLFFTPEMDCEDYKTRSYWQLEIVERIGSNMYQAKLNIPSIPYSPTPLYTCLQQLDSDDNVHDQYRYYSHQGTDYWVSIVTTKSFLPSWARIVLFIMLLTLSGLFSGLNLGLMSLDLSELDILKRIGTPNEQSYASKIYPLRKRGNFLLCTILLGNVLVNSVSTLLLGDMLSGIYAAFGSTILIVIFGEIIPQAACSKHGLAVGAYTRYIMFFFMIITSPLSFPLSIILDKVLGQEITATYSREKIREVMNVVEGLDDKEKKIISGALDFNDIKVREVMTKLDDVFMLELHSCLNFETIAKIAQEGYSRIPVYEETRDNIVGLLHVKDFTLLDPDDNMPVEALLKFYNHARIFCDAEETIDERFEEFRKGETHLAFVYDIVDQPDKDPIKKCIGIVTLEDIIEELVQMEIYDEFDDKKEVEANEANGDKQENDTRLNQDTDENENDFLLKNGQQSQLDKSKRQLTRYNSSSSSNAKVADQSISEVNESQMYLLETSKTFSNSSKSKKSNKTFKPLYESQVSKDLSFFLQQQKDTSQKALISPQIRFVMFQFLFTTVKPFTDEFLTRNVLELIFKRAVFKESRRSDPKLPREYLYKYGKGCNYFILILSGEATIEVGKEKLEFSAGPFAYFGVNGLLCGFESAEQMFNEDPSFENLSNKNFDSLSLSQKTYSKQYIPDFSLRVDEKCVFMKIDRDLWRNGVIKSCLERADNQKSFTIDDMPSNLGNKDDSILSDNKNFDVSPEKNRSASFRSNAGKENEEMYEMRNISSLNQIEESDNLIRELNDLASESNFESETEPFIGKKHSTMSLNDDLNITKKRAFLRKSTDKPNKTMSQKSFELNYN